MSSCEGGEDYIKPLSESMSCFWFFIRVAAWGRTVAAFFWTSLPGIPGHHLSPWLAFVPLFGLRAMKRLKRNNRESTANKVAPQTVILYVLC